MKIVSRPAQSRRSFARNVAAVIAVTAPIVILPFLLQSGASATGQVIGKAMTTSSGVACTNGSLQVSDLTVHSNATVTVSLTATNCDVQTVSLVAYSTHGPDYLSAGTQTLFDKDTQQVMSSAKHFSVSVPDCFFQIDLIYGADAPATLADQELYFTNHGTLIASYNAANPGCSGGPTSSGSSSASPTGTTTTAVKPTTTSASPSTSVSPSSTTSVSPTGLTTTTVTTNPPTSSTTTAIVGDTVTTTVASVSPNLSVEGVFFSQGAAGTSLPSTGLPVVALVLIGLELLAVGSLMMLMVRRGTGGAHR